MKRRGIKSVVVVLVGGTGAERKWQSCQGNLPRQPVSQGGAAGADGPGGAAVARRSGQAAGAGGMTQVMIATASGTRDAVQERLARLAT